MTFALNIFTAREKHWQFSDSSCQLPKFLAVIIIYKFIFSKYFSKNIIYVPSRRMGILHQLSVYCNLYFFIFFYIPGEDITLFVCLFCYCFATSTQLINLCIWLYSRSACRFQNPFIFLNAFFKICLKEISECSFTATKSLNSFSIWFTGLIEMYIILSTFSLDCEFISWWLQLNDLQVWCQWHHIFCDHCCDSPLK